MAALAFACVFGFLAWFFIAGEAMSDPGGLRGVGLVALWSLPLAALAVFAWQRPAQATTLLQILTAVVVVVGVWYASDSEAWRSFEDDHGPVRAIGVFVLMLPMALVGWRRPRVAGLMLLIVGLVPAVAASVTGRAGFNTTLVIGVPCMIDGILYLLSTVAGGETEWVA